MECVGEWWSGVWAAVCETGPVSLVRLEQPRLERELTARTLAGLAWLAGQRLGLLWGWALLGGLWPGEALWAAALGLAAWLAGVWASEELAARERRVLAQRDEVPYPVLFAVAGVHAHGARRFASYVPWAGPLVGPWVGLAWLGLSSVLEGRRAERGWVLAGLLGPWVLACGATALAEGQLSGVLVVWVVGMAGLWTAMLQLIWASSSAKAPSPRLFRLLALTGPLFLDAAVASALLQPLH